MIASFSAAVLLATGVVTPSATRGIIKSNCVPTITASAAALSTSSSYIVWYCTSRTLVYTSSSLTSPGSASSKNGTGMKYYNAYIDKGDECKIFKITNSFVFLEYPAGNSKRYGYIPTSKLTTLNFKKKAVKASAGCITFENPNLNKQIGYVDKNDKIYTLSYSGHSFQIIYSLTGCNNYKIGWVSENDYAKIANSYVHVSLN
jgi:hypothetical protein